MRHIFKKINLICAAALFVLSLCIYPVTAYGTQRTTPYRILVISSYDYSFSTVPSHLNGFTEGLGELYVDINYEFMNAKRVYGDSNIADFYSYLSNKLNHTSRYDLVVLIDDTALHFGMDYAGDLFPHVPIVFMGVNDIKEAKKAAAQDNVTGIAEVFDIDSNISLSSKLFPDRHQYVIITDNSNSARGEYDEFLSYAKLHPGLEYRTINMSDYSQAQIKELLSELENDSIIIYLDCLRDGSNNTYTLEMAASMLSECAPDVPIWRLSVVKAGIGIFGGLTYSYKSAGVMAGKLAAMILLGTAPEDLPLITDTVSEGYFDQDELDKYHIRVSQLPKDATVLHEHETFGKFYRENTLQVNLMLLVALLMIIIIVLLLVSNRRKKNLIRLDYLTKMPNRICITERIASVSESKEAFGIVMIDVDKFKTINDTMGHLVGDELLVTVAARLKTLSSRDIILARIGGDEFMGLIRKANKEKADRLCRDIVRIMKDDIQCSSGPIHITVSVGCAVYPLDTDSPDNVMELADLALYDIKEHGRDGYRLYCDLSSS